MGARDYRTSETHGRILQTSASRLHLRRCSASVTNQRVRRAAARASQAMSLRRTTGRMPALISACTSLISGVGDQPRSPRRDHARRYRSSTSSPALQRSAVRPRVTDLTHGWYQSAVLCGVSDRRDSRAQASGRPSPRRSGDVPIGDSPYCSWVSRPHPGLRTWTP